MWDSNAKAGEINHFKAALKLAKKYNWDMKDLALGTLDCPPKRYHCTCTDCNSNPEEHCWNCEKCMYLMSKNKCFAPVDEDQIWGDGTWQQLDQQYEQELGLVYTGPSKFRKVAVFNRACTHDNN